MLKLLIVLQLVFGTRTEYDPFIAYAQARIESTFHADTVSRVSHGKRRVGRWKHRFPSHWRGNFYCGIWQVKAKTEFECLMQRSLFINYITHAAEMRWWLRRCKGDRRCALSGYGCGRAGMLDPDNCGVSRGKRPYADRVMDLADALRRRSRGNDRHQARQARL